MNWKKPTHGHLEKKREPLESSPVIETIEKKNRRKRWNKTFTVLAGVVVFAMTYSLILPAFTIEEDEAEEMPGLEYETAYELAKDGDLLQIVPEDGTEGRIAVVVETDTNSENSASVLVLENDPVSGVQITEVAMGDGRLEMGEISLIFYLLSPISYLFFFFCFLCRSFLTGLPFWKSGLRCFTGRPPGWPP